MPKLKISIIAAAVMALTATAAFAAVTFDSETGEGFVGKGDVQDAFGWNNKALQENADSLEFRVGSESETTWTCKRDAGVQTQERTRTTTIEGLVSHVERVRNQITGFILEGYDGAVTTETEGPAIGSCPNFWSEVADSRETTSVGGGGVQVSADGTNWVSLGE